MLCPTFKQYGLKLVSVSFFPSPFSIFQHLDLKPQQGLLSPWKVSPSMASHLPHPARTFLHQPPPSRAGCKDELAVCASPGKGLGPKLSSLNKLCSIKHISFTGSCWVLARTRDCTQSLWDLCLQTSTPRILWTTWARFSGLS